MKEKQRIYFCIDMRTFYASVECAERNLNPFETDLVVADVTRGSNEYGGGVEHLGRCKLNTFVAVNCTASSLKTVHLRRHGCTLTK